MLSIYVWLLSSSLGYGELPVITHLEKREASCPHDILQPSAIVPQPGVEALGSPYSILARIFNWIDFMQAICRKPQRIWIHLYNSHALPKGQQLTPTPYLLALPFLQAPLPLCFLSLGRQTAIDIPYRAELFLFEGFVEFCSELIQCWPYFQLGDLQLLFQSCCSLGACLTFLFHIDLILLCCLHLYFSISFRFFFQFSIAEALKTCSYFFSEFHWYLF